MKKAFYESYFRKEFTGDNTFIEGFTLTKVIKEAEEELQKLYNNKEEYSKQLSRHGADCIIVNIDQYSFDTEDDDVQPTFENRWEFDLQKEKSAAVVYIDENGKAKHMLL